ncbi:hypothetical protein [Hyphococcus lacteus]|uniref:DUF4393 domain-containing protein n=1 Tax=Hyphococcus lacteus TaxID=3143536 RepID=A0ABV3Z3N1_9PROT
MTDELDDNIRDKLVSTAKGAAGIIPWAGGPLGEIISQVIPKQRLDRLVSYIRKLEDRIKSLETQEMQEALSSPAKIDLIETGGYQAARATQEQRVTHIVEAVFNGIKAPEVEVIRRKRLLSLLGELDDDEIAILNAHGQSYGSAGMRNDAWNKIERPGPIHNQSPRDELDKNALYEAGKDHLLRLGLLKQRFPGLKRGEYPDFDSNTGQFKGGVEVSPLGRLLLREIGMPSPFDNRGTA